MEPQTNVSLSVCVPSSLYKINNIYIFKSIHEVSLLSFRFKMVTRHCFLEALKILLLVLTISRHVLGVVPPVVVAYFIALSCWNSVVSCLTRYPGSGNNVPDTPTSFSGKSVSGEWVQYFHPPPSFRQLLPRHCSGWNLEILDDASHEHFQTGLAEGTTVHFD